MVDEPLEAQKTPKTQEFHLHFTLAKAYRRVVPESGVIFSEIAERVAGEVVLVRGVAERTEVGVMGSFDAHESPRADEAMKFLHGADDVGDVLDDVYGVEFVEGVVREGVWEMVQGADDIGGAGGVSVYSYGPVAFLEAAPYVENSFRQATG